MNAVEYNNLLPCLMLREGFERYWKALINPRELGLYKNQAK